MGIPRGQRQSLYVSRSIQGVVMGRFAIYWLGYHFVIWHAMLLYGYFHGNVMSTIFKGGGMPFWEYYGKFFAVNKSILICAVAICPILLWDTLRVTHRIAGPIVRFKDVLKRLTQGEKVTKIELRDNDLMEDLRDAFNEFLASRANTESIRSASRSAKDDAIDQVIDEVARQTEELKEITSAS